MSPRPSSWRVAFAWLPATLYVLLIWWLSSGPVSVQGIEYFPLADKGVHFVEYGALSLFIAFAISRTWPGRGARAMLLTVLLTASCGLMDELHQAFVPERTADVRDLLADSFGATFGALVYATLTRALARTPAP